MEQIDRSFERLLAEASGDNAEKPVVSVFNVVDASQWQEEQPDEPED